MRIDTDKIREGRLRRAWTQEQLAAVAGLGLRTVQRIERSGQASPESVQALAAVLELSPDELFRPAAAALVSPARRESDAALAPAVTLTAGLAQPPAPAGQEAEAAAGELPQRAGQGQGAARGSLTRRRVLGFAALALSGCGGLLLGRLAQARQLELAVDVMLDDQNLPTTRLQVEPGKKAEIGQDGVFRLELRPSLLEGEGMIFLHARLYRYRDEGYVRVMSPSLMMTLGEPAEIRLSGEVETYTLRVVATIQ